MGTLRWKSFRSLEHAIMLLLFLLFFLSLKNICLLHLFLAMLGLRCHVPAFSSCGYSLVAVPGLLTVAASRCRASASAAVVHGDWCPAAARGDLPRPGVGPMSLHWQVDNHWTTRKSYMISFLKCIITSVSVRART